VTLGYNMYLVHAGTIGFFKDFYLKLLERIDESIITYDIL